MKRYYYKKRGFLRTLPGIPKINLFFWHKLSPRRKLYFWTGMAAFFLILVPSALYIYQQTHKVEAAWFNDSWGYRQTINITSPSNLTDFQISIATDTASLITAGKMKPDCSDIRIIDQNGKQLPYWIEEATAPCNTASTKIWTKIPAIYSSGNTIYMYYGNPSANNVKDGRKVFITFEDFESYPTGTSIPGWTESMGDWVIETPSGKTKAVRLTGAAGEGMLVKNGNYSGARVIEADLADGDLSSNEPHPGLIVGYVNNSTRDAIYWRSQSTQLVRWPGGTSLTSGITGAVANTYYKMSIAIDGSGNVTNTTFLNKNINPGFSTQQSGTGIWSHATANGNGWIDNFRIRKYAATEPTVNVLGTEEKSPAPVAYWKFDEGQGTNFKSSSGTSATGSITSAVWQSEDQCINGKCLQYNGSTSFSDTNYDYSMDYNTGTTFSVWIRPTTTNTGGKIKNIFGKDSYEYILGQIDNKLNFHQWNALGSDAFSLTSNTTLEAGKWYHVALVYEGIGHTLTMYINGAYDNSQTSAQNSFVDRADSLKVGKAYGWGSSPTPFFTGNIDELKIYNHARSANQIKTDFASRGSVKGVSSQVGGNNVLQNSLSNGLVGYWKMDEASANTCGGSNDSCDSSGNGYNGAWNGDTTASASGKFGYCVMQDSTGSSGRIDLGNVLNMGTNNFTISMWVKLKSLSSPNAPELIGKINGGTGTPGYHIRVGYNDEVEFQVGGVSGAIEANSANSAITTDRWYLITAVYDKINGHKVYIDGKQSGTTVFGDVGNADSTNTLKIGRGFNGWGMEGTYDEVRVYNRALSPAEVSFLYNWAPGPVTYYNFEEGSGSQLKDISGNNHNGTITTPKWSKGKYGKSLDFTTGGYVDAGTGPIDFNGNWTVSFWANDLNTWVQQRGLVSKLDSGGYYGAKGVTFMHISSPQHLYLGISDGTNNKTADFNVGPKYGWTYITATRNGNNAYMYVNGQYLRTVDLTGVGDVNGSQNFTIGRGNSSSFYGGIDDLKVYNYARTPGQIVEDMNAGHPIGGSPIGSQLAYWKFDEGYGTRANDQKNYRNGTLTCTGATCTNPTWKNDGKFGKALYFHASGTDRSYVTTSPINISSTAGDKMTWTMWINPDASQAGSGWLMRNGTGTDENYGWRLGSLSGGKYKIALELYDTGFRSISTTNYIVPSSGWNNIAVVYSQGQWFKTYVNGILKETTTVSYGPSVQSTSSFNIGGHSGTTGQYFNGYIDEVKIYNDELTADQIKLDMNQGKALILGSFSDTSKLAGGSIASNSASAIYCVPGSSDPCSPPVGEWNFEEGQGSTVNDSSGNGNAGTWDGTGKHWGQGKNGKAGIFNGSNDTLLNNSSGFLPSGDSPRTISYWFKPNPGMSDANSAVAYGCATEGYNCFSPGVGKYVGTWATSTSIGAHLETCQVNGPTYSSTTAWHYYTAVFNGNNTITFYIDGQTPTTVTPSCTIDTSSGNGIEIGVGRWGYYNGSIDDVKIYDYARTPAQVAWDYNQGKPVGHWKFDECQGLTLGDSSGNGNSGTITIGGTAPQTTAGTCSTPIDGSGAWYNGRAGKYNSSMSFDGADDSISLGPILTMNTSDLTVAMWIKGNSPAANSAAFSKGIWGAGRATGYGILAATNSSNKFDFEIGGTVVQSKKTIDTSWHHVVGTRKGSTLSIYVDGILEDAHTVTPVDLTYSSTLNLGQRGVGVGYFAGQIDDVRVYNYALTPIQIKTVMNQGAAVRWGPNVGQP